MVKSNTHFQEIFYANLTISDEKGLLLCSTQIKIRSFSFIEKLLGKILGVPSGNHFNLEKEKSDHIARAQTEYYNVPPPYPRKPTHNILNLEGKLLHNIIQRCLLHRSNTTDQVLHSTLSIMDNVMNGQDIDIPNLIITSMHTAITSKRGSPLPSANLLPKIFAHFDINLEDEEKEKVNGKFDEKALKNLGIIKDGDTWTTKFATSKPLPITEERFKSFA